ncbi:DNA adenine methylase [Halomicrococcus gelatinilyticus]|uniref:DNA adenine methylase n=1 Tax=Halomicrococcus gelatinilyticus TaxID=1702103 RepID=UPI002E12003A
MVNPVLKWAGGKRQLLDELSARFPEDYNHFHEPFFGGGALFFDLEPENGTINDTNIRLINFYEQVRDHPEELIDRLESYRDPEDDPDSENDFAETNHKGKEIKNYYYQQRARFNKRPYGESFDPIEEAALLLYLNRTCYNGLYRQNSSGGFNVPIGRYANPDWVQEQRIRKASDVLKNTEIFNRDFKYILEYAEPGDLVYFDPPYEPMSSTAYFTDYSAEGFGQEDQERLLEVAQELDEQGVYVILSNSGVMYDMYDNVGFSVEIEGATRAINSDAENRDKVDEIIATNVPEDERRGRIQKGLADFS